MKKYVTPVMKVNWIAYCDDIAIPGDSTITTSMQLGKERAGEPEEEMAFGGDPEWKNGLW